MSADALEALAASVTMGGCRSRFSDVGRTAALQIWHCPKVEMARPTGVGRAITAYDMPIEGRDEWLTAARRLA
jgi:hypothetical protein